MTTPMDRGTLEAYVVDSRMKSGIVFSTLHLVHSPPVQENAVGGLSPLPL